MPAAGASVGLTPREGKIGDWVDIELTGFSGTVRTFFSSDEADIGDKIGNQVRAYMYVSKATFRVPARLEGGTHQEDVHGGTYYVYAVEPNEVIVAMATFTVIGGELSLEPEEGSVGDEIEISGQDLHPEQAITVRYDDIKIAIAGGDTMTDGQGGFTCTIIIPDGIVGEHVIVVADESEDKPEAVFTVVPKITLVPSQQEGGKGVEVNGAGFAPEHAITLTVDGDRVDTTPYYIETDLKGSFSCTLAAPLYNSPTVVTVVAIDLDSNRAEAQLTVLGSIRLSPPATSTSPGHAGMELTIYGVGFAADSEVDISYNEGDQVIFQATVTANPDGNFTTIITVLPSTAGGHLITATDGDITATVTFFMESDAPPVPVPQLPEVAGTTEEEARFDWSDVTDPSGVSYTLQVASDANFNAVILEKAGLSLSECTLTATEKLAPSGHRANYWRVKAVDGAANEGEWSSVGLFYVGFSRTTMAGGIWYVFYGLGALVLAGLVFWFYRRRSR